MASAASPAPTASGRSRSWVASSPANTTASATATLTQPAPTVRGKFFKIGAGIYRPIAAPTAQTIVGSWTAAGTRYVFHANGTYEMGQAASGSGWASGARVSGPYSVDGHLVVMRPQGGQITIVPMGLVTPRLLLIDGIFYERS